MRMNFSRNGSRIKKKYPDLWTIPEETFLDYSDKEIADKYGCSMCMVSKVRIRRTGVRLYRSDGLNEFRQIDMDALMKKLRVNLDGQVKVYSRDEYDQEFLKALIPPKQSRDSINLMSSPYPER